MAAIVCEPWHFAPLPSGSLQSLPKSSLSWCRSRKPRVKSSSRVSAFRPDPDRYGAPDNRAASSVAGVKLIDLTPLVCPDGVCRAVIGDALVFRDYDHLTPTFAATLAPMIERRLPHLG